MERPAGLISKTEVLHNRCLIGIELGTSNIRIARIQDNEIEQTEVELMIDNDDPSEQLQQIQHLIEQAENEIDGITN